MTFISEAKFRLLISLMVVFSAISSSNAQPALTIDDIIVVGEAVRQSVRTIDVTYEITQTLTGGAPNSQYLPNTRVRVVLDLEAGDYAKYAQVPDENGKMVERVEARVENTKLNYEPANPSAVIEEDKDEREVRRILQDAVVLHFALLLPPKTNGIGLDDGCLASLLRQSELREATEQIEGRKCHVVDAFAQAGDQRKVRYATAWIDVERGALPLRLIGYSGDNGEIGFEQLATEVTQFSDSDGKTIWLPTTVRTLTKIQGSDFESRHIVDVKRTRFNPALVEKDYSTDFPSGTVVYDMDEGTSFTVPGHRRAATRDLGWEIEEEESEASLRWRFVLASVALIIAIALGWRFRRRWTRNG